MRLVILSQTYNQDLKKLNISNQYMSNQYRSVFPLSQRDEYTGDQNIDYVLSLDNVKIVPGTVTFEGEVITYATGSTPMTDALDVKYDCRTGMHALFRSITTEFQSVGVVEDFQNYPRFVKMQTCATTYDDSLATESNLACECRAPTERIAHGYLLGKSDGYLPFSIKPLICLNKATAPISGNAIGTQVRLRLRLSPNQEFLYGTGMSSSVSYGIKNLRLRYQTIPDDGKVQDVMMESYFSYRTAVDSGNQNVSTFVPGLADSVHASFIGQAAENTLQSNFLQCPPLPGVAPLGCTSDEPFNSYGVERLYWSVNDTDTAVCDFELQSREEIVYNALRSFNAPPTKYGALIRHFQEAQPDCYFIGLPFGSLLDFSKSKFACELQSSVTSAMPFAAYFFFRSAMTIKA
jgi:hypothetical protein